MPLGCSLDLVLGRFGSTPDWRALRYRFWPGSFSHHFVTLTAGKLRLRRVVSRIGLALATRAVTARRALIFALVLVLWFVMAR
ncbi:hypothetical protein [Bradyrhizobium sp. LeoA1S1]